MERKIDWSRIGKTKVTLQGKLADKWKDRLYYGVGRYMPFLKIKPPHVDRKAAMTLRPGRNSLLTYEKRETGETVLTIPQNEKVNPITRAMARWLRAPKERKVELDEVGGFVWELCDGDHTVEAIVHKTSRQYKLNRREAEVSVTMFLQMLHERNFIGFYKKDYQKDYPKNSSQQNSKQEKVVKNPGNVSSKSNAE